MPCQYSAGEDDAEDKDDDMEDDEAGKHVQLNQTDGNSVLVSII